MNLLIMLQNLKHSWLGLAKLSALRVDWRDVVVLWSAFLISLGSGTLYVYSAYATQLAERLELTASQVELVGLVGSTGVGLMSTVAGVLIDKTGHRIPVALGGTLLFTGYLTIYIAYQHKVASMILLAVSLFGCGFGGTLCFMSTVKVTAVCFPHIKGTATAIPLAGFGLSALFFTLLWTFIKSTENMILSLSLVTSGLAFIHLPLLGLKNYDTAVPDKDHISEEEQFLVEDGENEPGIDEFELEEDSQIKDLVNVVDPREEDRYILKQRAFWELYLLMSCISGIGQMYIYSCGYSVRALFLVHSNLDSALEDTIRSAQTFQVAFISVFNFASRLVSGLASDYLVNKGYQRVWMMEVAAAFCFVAQVLGQVVSSEQYLWMVSIATGNSYGLLFGVFPSIANDAFGTKNFSQNMGWLATSYVLSSFIFNTLFGKIYDSHSDWDDKVKEYVCKLGVRCYSRVYFITMLVAGFSGLWGLYLIHSRRLTKYQRAV